MNKITVGIVGAAGLGGIELYKRLIRHPGVEVVFITSETYAGKNISYFLPELIATDDLIFENLNAEKQAGIADAVFLALPDKVSIQYAATFVKDSVVIDLSAAYRLEDTAEFEKWYRYPHTDQASLTDAVYGLSEWNRDAIKTANLIANPGCYPTSVLLPLLPLLKKGLIKNDRPIIVDSKSGVSGMGRKTNSAASYLEIDSNFRAYGVGIHRHSPEISQELNKVGNIPIQSIFTPHLLPLKQGILSTIYLLSDSSADECNAFLTDFYKDERFVKVGGDMLPETGKIVGTNMNWFSVVESAIEGTLVIVSAIDNLIKGASGQALQNFNIRFGFAEETGLV